MVETALIRKERENPYKGIRLPDTVREQTNRDSGLSDLLVKYEEFLNKESDFDQIEKIINKETISLTPDKIDDFLQQTILYENHKDYQTITGILISQLIQTSYNAGNNDFELNTKKLKTIDRIGAYLIGKERNPIIITIQGNTGYKSGLLSENSIFNIKGNTGDCYGWESKGCTFNIEKDAGDQCGYLSTNSIFNIQGNTGNNCGESSDNCRFNIEGNTGYKCGFLSRDSIFNIEGDTGNDCGEESENCTFHIFGEADNWTGDAALNCIFNIHGDSGDFYGIRAQKSTFNIRGKVGDSCGNNAENSTFSTSNTDSYKKFQQYVSKSNKIILTDKNGKSIECDST